MSKGPRDMIMNLVIDTGFDNNKQTGQRRYDLSAPHV
jgi:hypothetical protein